MQYETPLFFIFPTGTQYFEYDPIFSTEQFEYHLRSFKSFNRNPKIEFLVTKPFLPVFRSLHLIQQCPMKPKLFTYNMMEVIDYLAKHFGLVLTQDICNELLVYIEFHGGTSRFNYLMGLVRCLREIKKIQYPKPIIKIDLPTWT